jgi:thiol-disulfide isomerase/thioredoxin
LKGKGIVIAVIVAIGIALVVFGRRDDSRPKPMPVFENYEAPDISLRDIGGNSWRLSARRGSVVLINFWATWCDTCKEEMPGLQRLYDAKKSDPKFELVTILFDDDPTAGIKYLKENGYTLPLYIDTDGSAAVAYGLTGVPETYVVGKKGILRKKIIGPADFDDPGAVAFLTRLLAEGA